MPRRIACPLLALLGGCSGMQYRVDRPIDCPSQLVPIGIGGLVLGAGVVAIGAAVAGKDDDCDLARNPECTMKQNGDKLLGVPLIIGGVVLGGAGIAALMQAQGCHRMKKLQERCLAGDTQACAAMKAP